MSNTSTPEPRLPCRGCSDNCKLRDVCRGAPWNLTREEQDRLLGRSPR